MSIFTGVMFLFCAIVGVGITEGAPQLDWAWALVFVPSMLGMIFFGLGIMLILISVFKRFENGFR